LIEYNENAGSFSSKIKINSVKYEQELDYLREKGKQGWELVQAPTHGFSCYYFKRTTQ
jgi:hypothetical protein